MENVEILSSAANLYNKGKVVYRKEADQLIQENIESINLTFLGERDFPRLPRGEKFATIVAMGLHPASNTIAFEFLLDIIPEALEESSAFSYRLLSAIKRLLLRGIWSDSILKHQKNLSMFPEIGNRDVQVAANAVLGLIKMRVEEFTFDCKISPEGLKTKDEHAIANKVIKKAAELYDTGGRNERKTADNLIQKNIDNIKLSELLTFSVKTVGEKTALAAALGRHLKSNKECLDLLFDLLQESVGESTKFGFRVLASIRKLLSNGIWSESILSHDDDIDFFVKFGGRDSKIAAKAIAKMIAHYQQKNKPQMISAVSSTEDSELYQDFLKSVETSKLSPIERRNRITCMIFIIEDIELIIIKFKGKLIPIQLSSKLFKIFLQIAIHQLQNSSGISSKELIEKACQSKSKDKAGYLRKRINALNKHLLAEGIGALVSSEKISNKNGYIIFTDNPNINLYRSFLEAKCLLNDTK